MRERRTAGISPALENVDHLFSFFFEAEDGIRDLTVTGVQTCALPICAPCETEVDLAEAVRQRMPAVEMVRFVNSGTEATMAALRLARAATRRELVLKFEEIGRASCR